jgi:hypothetical protein
VLVGDSQASSARLTGTHDNEPVRRVRGGGIRQGPRNFDSVNKL